MGKPTNSRGWLLETACVLPVLNIEIHSVLECQVSPLAYALQGHG
jgi:hypothetical protein